MGIVPQINNGTKTVGMGGSMSPIRKSFADPRFGVNKNVQDPRTKTIKELSKIKDQYK